MIAHSLHAQLKEMMIGIVTLFQKFLQGVACLHINHTQYFFYCFVTPRVDIHGELKVLEVRRSGHLCCKNLNEPLFRTAIGASFEMVSMVLDA